MTTAPKKVIYDSIEEYKLLRLQFGDELPLLIERFKIHNWTHRNSRNQVRFGIGFADPFRDTFKKILCQAINKLTKAHIPEWSEEMATVLCDAIHGMAKSVAWMAGIQLDIECEATSWIHSIDVQDAFKIEDVCSRMITGVVHNILFDTEGDLMGVNNEGEGGSLGRVSMFKCTHCENAIDVAIHSVYNPPVCGGCKLD